MNERLASIVVGPDGSIRDAMEVINRGGVEIALVVDERRNLLGTISDGDVRRALLSGADLDDAARPLANPHPYVVSYSSSRSEVLEVMRQTGHTQLPVLDEDGRLVGLHVMHELLGAPGRVSITTQVPLAVPHLGGNEARYLQECIETNFVSSVGPFVDRFETEFASAIGARHAVACSSGTAALHVALELLGVRHGSLVAVSTFSFIASANAITYAGGDPLFVDSEPRTWNMDAELLHSELRQRAASGRPLPVAIEIVHVLGQPADIEPLLAIRDELGILIVEDAAEALGATYIGGPLDGRHVGTIGDIGCFSFNGNKVITSGGGGMIVTNDDDLAARAKHLTTQAKLPGTGYHHDAVGYNYRLGNVAAALGLAQLEQLDLFLGAKRRIAAAYDRALAPFPVELPPRTSWASSTYWLYSMLMRDDGLPADVVVRALIAEGIQARPLWPPLHMQLPYQGADAIGGDVAEQIYRRGVSLPSSVGLTDDDQHAVVAVLERLFRAASRA